MWMTYLATSDADATAVKIKGAGGQLVMEAMDVMDAGRMAVAVDPAGAVFGIWQARAFPGAQIVNEPGTMRWNEQVSRHSRSTARTSGASATFTPASRPVPRPAGGMYFGAADTDASVARVQANGGSVIREPIDHPCGRMSTVADDQGAVFSLLGVTPG